MVPDSILISGEDIQTLISAYFSGQMTEEATLIAEQIANGLEEGE